MATTVGAVAGTKIYIGGTDSVPSPDDYIEITNVANLGDIGTMFSKIAVESIGDGYTRQIKGTESAPTFPLIMNRDDDDPGQMLVKTASADRNNLYNFKVVENDIGSGASATTGTFKGRVYGFARKYGAVNTLKQVTSDIEIEPDSIVVVAAA